ncbi:FxsB family cyclophane-forming radical SAM/SPASM peptide maturase [Plantactinospora sp. GCM10030261]|uniref:FxsB family cyclophane-forming radical SAM/SPASM peptide maturase n=1 Tax=Plantactinospora sp. GCM10030261 TaxID=3273420 RepID=UPI00360F1C8F
MEGSRTGRPAAALRQILLKVHGRCNLACDYCYVYEHADQGWRRRTGVMSRAVVDRAADRIAAHVEERDISGVRIVLHGGEPLLAGASFIDYGADRIRRSVRASTRVAIGVQTNGTLLDETFLDVFHQHDITVGVSVDGDPAANDRHRRYTDGRSSYRRVARGIALLNQQRHRSRFAGLLCTIDLANDPVATYESLLAFAPPRLDLLLPHGNWQAPPPGRLPGSPATPYADWLIAVFDRWYDAPRRETDIRLFSSAISLLLGGPGGSEVIGPDPTDLVVVETDGTIEQHDALKTTVDGGAATGLSVFDNSFDDVLAHPGWRTGRGGTGLGSTCRACPIVRVCGGGLRAHRFDPRHGFDRPSVYCPDLLTLITHIRRRLAGDLDALRSAGTGATAGVRAGAGTGTDPVDGCAST